MYARAVRVSWPNYLAVKYKCERIRELRFV